MKKVHYIMLGIIIVIVMILIVNNQKNKGEENSINEDNNIVNIEQNIHMENENIIEEIQTNEITQEDISKIKEIKQEIGANADTDIYQIDEEPGGREILQIKPSIQFEVDLAGIIKNAKPEEGEIRELIKKIPSKNGVWISENSRSKFNELLNNNKVNNIIINEEGYLINKGNSENESSKKLENMIKSNKLFIININGICYERDYISGEIIEYPFEEMDPVQIVEPYMKDNTIILEITSNKGKKLKDEEILEAITAFK